MEQGLKEVAMTEKNEKWENSIKREDSLYNRNNDIRSEFERDYTRILHSKSYRRLKHKTQVFFSPENDHICTRAEHVALVESISYTISNYMGLNIELTKAIATGHDIGHSPFGHQGERILSEISKKEIGESFWHEKNGLEIVDNIELLEDPKGNLQNLNLTYAVRDGIISHCGEVDEKRLKPRKEYVNLKEYKTPNQYAPYTWEGCVVKISDRISYLGRDIADAITIGILDENLEELYQLLEIDKNEKINNTTIINNLIYDLCKHSSVEDGLCFSDKAFQKMNELKRFNYKNIYLAERLNSSNEYFKVAINKIYEILKESYYHKTKIYNNYFDVISDFEKWLTSYWNLKRDDNNKNKILFDMDKEEDYKKAIIYYISGMTDNYAMKMYNKIIRF